jgi:hypothetical protein
MSSGRRAAPVIALGLILALLAPGSAAATYDPIGGGSTTLRLAPAFLANLKIHRVTIDAVAPAKLKKGTITFPVVTGQLDPVAVKGTVQHEGVLVFRRGRRELPMKALQLKTTQKSSPLSAKFGGGKLKLAARAKLTTARAGFGMQAKVKAMALSAKVATRLNKKLGLRGVFAPGEEFGSSLSTLEPASVAIAATGKAELSIDAAFATKLQSVFVAVNPIFPAEHPGTFTFPIAGGGSLAPDLTSGNLKTAGALEFIQIGGGQFFVRELEPELSGRIANAESQLVLASSGPGPNEAGAVFALGAGATSAERGPRTISLADASLTLEASTAQAFNEAFAKPLGKEDVFHAGEVVGTLGFTATGE